MNEQQREHPQTRIENGVRMRGKKKLCGFNCGAHHCGNFAVAGAERCYIRSHQNDQ